MTTTDSPIPHDITLLARQRADARRDRQWAEADRLREAIEAAGWTIVDRGGGFRLSPGHPEDWVADGVTRYGWSGAVPSRLAEPDAGEATASCCSRPPTPRPWWAASRRWSATFRPCPWSSSWTAGGRALRAATAARSPSRRAAAPLPQSSWSGCAAVRGLGACLNAGLRRATGAVVIVLDPRQDLAGDIVEPLARALDDAAVGVAGAFPLAAGDVRRFRPVTGAAATGRQEADAVDLGCLAFRRADGAERGPLEERFHGSRALAAWWSLVLRDEGDDRPPRRAVAVGLPLGAAVAGTEAAAPDEGRLERRDAYRLLDRFGLRPDLLAAPDQDRQPWKRKRP